MEKFTEQMCDFIERESAQFLGETCVNICASCNENGENNGFYLLVRYNGNKQFDAHCHSLSDVLYKWEQLKEMLQFATSKKEFNE